MSETQFLNTIPHTTTPHFVLPTTIDLAKEWVNILSINPLPDDYYAVAIEYTVPPDPKFEQSAYKTATRWVKYVLLLDKDTVFRRPDLDTYILNMVRGVREVLRGRA